ncbi:protein-export chaperone SecB [Paenibacillus xylanexedens]|uniref:protein-export chaperone SecB n=1 Tax=Paenibacillus xylanexedens TaxID=528191 RepID=UPI0011A3C21F|nr:protein-export chaperone SecB [Paenibacillus xylanexedens]
MKAAIQFMGYKILKISFQNNLSHGREPQEIDGISLGHEVKISANKIVVDIDCSIGEENADDSVYVSVMLQGYFGLDYEKTGAFDEGTLRDICTRNTLSILFPYLRSVISNVTLNANIDPIIIPTINVNALIDNQDDLT